MSDNSIQDLISEETKRRLDIMSSEDYKFPEKITKTDILLIVSIISVCAVLIALCMLGVIE